MIRHEENLKYFFIYFFAASVMICNADASIDTLDIDTYVKTAIEHSFLKQKSLAMVDAGTAALMSSRSRILPHIDFQGSTSRNASPAGTGSSPSTLNSVSIGAQQTIFAFGKNKALIHSSSLQLEAARQDETGTIGDIVLAARTAYLSCLLAQETYKLTMSALLQSKAHFAQSSALFEAGKIARYGVIKARVDTANASVNCIKARHGLMIAKIQLENTLCTSLADTVVFADSLCEPSILFSDTITSISNRNDIAAAQKRLEASHQQVLSARRSALPNLSASASTGFRETLPGDWKSNWSIGAGLSAPIFQGGANMAAIRSAESTERMQSASLEILKLSALKEVRQYTIEIADAKERLGASLLLIEQATEGLALSTEKFAQGSASSIEVTDAETTLAQAGISRIQALYDLNLAILHLKRAQGLLKD